MNGIDPAFGDASGERQRTRSSGTRASRRTAVKLVQDLAPGLSKARGSVRSWLSGRVGVPPQDGADGHGRR
jgi:hypothetical protein